MNDKYESPSIWRRFMSMFYEIFLLIGPIFFIVFVYIFFFAEITKEEDIPFLQTLIIQALIFSTVIIYFVWGWSNGRGTLAMKTLSLEVVSIDGKKLNISKALIRVFIAIPSVMTGVWLIFGLIRKDCQCPHDILSGTMLVIKKNGEK